MNVLILLLLFNYCSSANIEDKQDECDKGEVFDEFYRKFHTDSSFQLSRIDFPLKGYKRTGNENPDINDGKYYWKKKNWIVHKKFDLDDNSIYKQDKVFKDTLVVDKIYIENSGFSIERHFKLIDCKWKLVYYSEIDL